MVVVVKRIPQNVTRSAAAAVDGDDDAVAVAVVVAAVVAVVPFLAGLVVRYVLGLSPVTKKPRYYSRTLQLKSVNSFPPVNILLNLS
jgi:hypothetical protein